MDDRTRDGLDRRALLGKIAAAGAVGWTAPVILSKPAAAAGVFTGKCAPGTVTGVTTSVNWLTCTFGTSSVEIRLDFSGPCPCGGGASWCIRKTSPGGTASSSSSSITFTVGVPYLSSTTVSGQVAMRCVDRDGDYQWASYNWSMVASDSGAACNSAFSGTNPVLTNRQLHTQTACPLPASFSVSSSSSAPVARQAPVGRSID